jgi:phi13 family phage major tail protein
MAHGRVRVGFSLPYVATYVNTSGTITYTGGMRLARGVEVSLSPEYSDSTDFYADNGVQESEAGTFTGGSVTLTCDDPLAAAKALIEGTPAADTDGWVKHGDSISKPYVGLGWIVEYVSGGVHTWVPTVVRKAKLASIDDEASTREDDVEYQTTAMEFNLHRDDSANHDWKWVNEAGYETEAAAEAALKTALGITG